MPTRFPEHEKVIEKAATSWVRNTLFPQAALMPDAQAIMYLTKHVSIMVRFLRDEDHWYLGRN